MTILTLTMLVHVQWLLFMSGRNYRLERIEAYLIWRHNRENYDR